MQVSRPTDLPTKAQSEPKWLIYQKAVARLKESYGDCEVLHDHKKVGRRSGVERQVDIWLSANIGGESLSVAVECKCHEESPVSIKDVDAFYGFLDDVAANKGVLISSTGFTDGAKRRADGADIALKTITLEEAQNFDWAEYLSDECESLGECWGGTIHWQFQTAAGDEGGYCSHCGSFHVKCAECGEVGTYDWNEFKCDGCDTKWGLMEHKGEIVRFYRIEPDDIEPDDEDEIEEEADEEEE